MLLFIWVNNKDVHMCSSIMWSSKKGQLAVSILPLHCMKCACLIQLKGLLSHLGSKIDNRLYNTFVEVGIDDN